MAILSTPVDFIKSIPPATRAFTATTIIASLAYNWFQWQGHPPPAWLVLIPGSSLFFPWTFLTSAVVETSLLELLLTLLFIPASLKYLERLWGTLELVKFIIVTVVASNIITVAVNWIEFVVLRNADLFLYGMAYHGQMSLQIGVLVAFTQLIPEHQLQVLGVFRARVKVLPMAYLTLSTVLCIFGFQCPWIVIQFGWFVSWVYLRFYKKNASDISGDTYGDRSETFSLLSWFPPFIHYPLGKLGDFVYTNANRFHLIPATYPDLEGGHYNQPGHTRAEAERRRAMALKALDQRVANSSPVPGASSSSQPVQAPRPSSSSKTDVPAPAAQNDHKPSTGDGEITDVGK
ncbi:eukaryotic integral membrane protein [Flagelloscypha sp. PMI_526]|nr:eukaryotic integral membrane protein [Flagelloscypha sp. PMI_526]